MIGKTNATKTIGRVLSAFALVALPLISLAGQVPSLPESSSELQQITFSPQLTPINFTVTPQPTIVGPLEALDSSTQQLQDEQDDDGLGISGGDWEVGYDLVETEDGVQWHLWANGEVIIVEPDDPATASLISAFMIQADNRADARTAIDSAKATRDIAYGSAGAGLFSLIGGTVTAVIGCAGTPLTFWAAGGTGWACAGGIVAGVGGLGALAASSVQIVQSGNDIEDAETSYDNADRAAEELFDTLKDSSNSP